MWPVADPERWSRAVASSHTVAARVEVWAGGRMLTESAEFLDGSVTDDWVVAGVRRSLSMSVPPSRLWLRWFDYDLLEVRPFLGVRFTRYNTEECPMGVYPLTPPQLSRPYGPIAITASDRADKIVDADFVDKPVPRPAGPIVDAISWLVTGAGLPAPENHSTARGGAGEVLLDQTRMDALADAARSISVEVTLDRVGVPRIDDARVLGAATSSILTGDGGMAIGLSVKPDPKAVYNVVSVKSSMSGVEFPAQVARIAWDGHPAHPQRLGRERVYHYASPLLSTPEQALQAAFTILAKKSAAARTTVYQSFPNPAVDAGDSVLGATFDGTEIVQVANVTHPFRPKDSTPSQITTVSTQLDVT